MTTLQVDNIVFVYGALRSGTTVFRLMLDAHPRIANPGEMDFLCDFLARDPSHATGWRYDLARLRLNRQFLSKDLALPPGKDGLDLLADFLDQLQARHPGQIISINMHRHLSRVLDVLPQARIIHMLRDPRDVARSSIPMGWAGTLYHGVNHWLLTEADWDAALAAHPDTPIHEVRYERLFEATEEVLRGVCAFFDVAYDPQMLRYHETTSYGPPDVSLTYQWRRKSQPQELALLEHRAGPMMTARGYAPEQAPITLSERDKARMRWQDRIYRWRFGMRRFGAFTYWGERITQKLQLGPLHRPLRRRVNRIQTQHLK